MASDFVFGFGKVVFLFVLKIEIRHSKIDTMKFWKAD